MCITAKSDPLRSCWRFAAAGVPLWRGFAGMRTLHPQWAGYPYTWWRDRDAVDAVLRERGKDYEQDLRDSPFASLIGAALNSAGGRGIPLRLRRRLTGREARRDFPYLGEIASAGASVTR